jgi:two-component system phosphate regulon response regulator PhoB
MSKPRALVVEDERDIAELVAHHLRREGYDVSLARDGEEGIRSAEERIPDVVLLDLLMPKLDGLEVCRRLRRSPRTRGIPILMVSAKDHESDVVSGLELGADDYVTKPFSPAVLLARVRAVLRRREQADDAVEVVRHGPFVVDSVQHRVTVAGKEVDLPLTGFKLLRHLAAHPGRVFTRNQLLEVASGPDAAALDRTIDVHVAALRKRLGKHGECIATVRGVGYKLAEE